MRQRLPKEVYRSLLRTIDQGEPLDPAVADVVAATHEGLGDRERRQPLHPLVPAAHRPDRREARLARRAGRERRGGVQLLRLRAGAGRAGRVELSRRAASGPPSRPAATPRGTPPARPSSCGATTTSPSASRPRSCPGPARRSTPRSRCSARSRRCRSRRCASSRSSAPTRACRRVYTTVGPEQEYFLVDRELYFKRPDLLTCERTLFGAKPPKGQQLEDHYFGTIPPRVLAFMAEVGAGALPARRAGQDPAQRGGAGPVRDRAAVRAEPHRQRPPDADHGDAQAGGAALRPPGAAAREAVRRRQRLGQAQQLVDVAPTPASTCSIRRTRPTPTCSSWCSWCATIRAVDIHADLLRASIASAANDHRLGANEAPPAIISIFLGKMLTDILEQVEKGLPKRTIRGGTLDLGAKTLPHAAAPLGRPQPDLAVRLHRQQVRVPRRGLERQHRLAQHGAQHHRGRVARLRGRPSWSRRSGAKPVAGPAAAGRPRGAQAAHQGAQAGHLRRRQLLRGVARRGGAARAAEPEGLGRGVPGAAGQEERATCSRSTAC